MRTLHHLGLSHREAVGGNQLPGALRANTPRDLNLPLPSGSILKSPNPFDTLADVSPTLAVGQATIDFLKVIVALLFVGVTGFGIGVSIFFFLFL